MTQQFLALAALILLLVGATPCGVVHARSGHRPPSKTPQTCTGPAVDADPERFACAGRTRRRNPQDLPLPRGADKPPQDDSGIELADGVTLDGRLGPRELSSGPKDVLDSVTNKRTAIVPRGQEPGLGRMLMHGASDGVSLGLNFDVDFR